MNFPADTRVVSAFGAGAVRLRTAQGAIERAAMDRIVGTRYESAVNLRRSNEIEELSVFAAPIRTMQLR